MRFWDKLLLLCANARSSLLARDEARRIKIRRVCRQLTLVRPAEAFETVNLDSSGIGEIALPTGDSVVLLQAEEIWEVRLSFRDYLRGARLNGKGTIGKCQWWQGRGLKVMVADKLLLQG
jgi:hypothetical protein